MTSEEVEKRLQDHKYINQLLIAYEFIFKHIKLRRKTK